MFDPSFQHPAVLAGEPVRQWGALGTLRVLTQRSVVLVLVTILGLPFWLGYAVLRVFFPRPPIVCSFARVLRCAVMIFTERPTHGPTTAMRIGLLLELGRRVATSGVIGLAWFLDALLYGKALRQVRIVEPLFEISAARSGSTQLSRYLEDDPRVCAPRVLQIVLPFVWLWRIASRLQHLAPDGWTETLSHSLLPKEHHERHEVDILRTDTFEMLFLVLFQLGDIFLSLGPRALAQEFRFDRVQEPSRQVWECDFLRFIDEIGRKTLWTARRHSVNQAPRLFLKGHFLLVADALAERYPGARFLTVLRAPEKRLQSLINFLRCQGTVAPCPAVPWSWLVEYACTAEVSYSDTEIDFYRRDDGPRRCIIRFDDYLRDLPGTLQKVYRQCLDCDLPPHAPRSHAPRSRTNYSVDRSLVQLGVDESALRQRLGEYGRFCKGE